MKEVKAIHFVGIKGVGMAPLAIIAKEAGFSVTGSDIGEEFITDAPLKRAGIVPQAGFSAERVLNADLVITTGAHGGFDNEEVKKAKELGIKILTQGEAVGAFMNGEILKREFTGISVAGSHGKTTTTAMLSVIFKENNYDPTFIIGTGDVPALGAPGHYGKGRYFIAEADEYATEPNYNKTPKFLWQHPKIEIITNIELDHPDLYESVDKIREAFLQFAKNLAKDGLLIISGDDEQSRELVKSYNGHVITFGTSPVNDYIIKKNTVSGLQTFFWVETKEGVSLGEFSISVAGEHNALNALGAVIAALECGLSLENIKKVLSKFTGSKRRFEYMGKLPSGTLIFDDYAHHPTEIKKTLQAFRRCYPEANIVCIFQPHTYSRTKILFEQFIRSFSDANLVIICDIYPSLREKLDLTVSSKLFVEAMSKFHRQVLFLPKLVDVVEYINQNRFGPDSILLTMGAGDVYKISEKLEILPAGRQGQA